MTDRSTFDAFEQRIADELGRYVAPVTDLKPAAAIARTAMRPRGLAVRARNASRRRRFLVLGLAAVFLLPAGYFGAASVSPPAPDVVQPSRTADPRPTAVPSTSVASRYVSIFVRRDEGPEPGVAIFAVRPDGAELLLRKVPDTILSDEGGHDGRGKMSEWGSVSSSGWLVLGVDLYGGPWPMVIVDLRDNQVKPWVVNEANIGGIGPRWGPTGLVAASLGSGGGLVIADPETHTTGVIAMNGHGLVGGGPSIVWSADGTGIVGSMGTYDTNGIGTYDVVPLDGGALRPVGQVFDPRGDYGPGLAQLRVCSSEANCPGGGDGRIERFAPDGSVQAIWKQQGVDRALSASFGGGADEYWLSVDHDGGRQVAFVHVHDGRQDTVATVNRNSDWNYLAAPVEAPDDSAVLTWIDIGAKPAAVLVPLNGAAPTFHTGQFAGFVDGGGSAVFSSGQSRVPVESMPAAGKPYALPSVDELIAAELRLNPGRVVLGKATHDAVDGETDVHTFEVHRDQPGAGEAYLDCLGPSIVTVTSGSNPGTSPCLRAGSFGFSVDATAPIVVTASGDTTWRVVIYSP